MAPLLSVQPFSAAPLPEVQDFQCGDDRWDVEVADWIKAPPDHEESAVNYMLSRGTEVWLYRDDEGGIVGYGSLGKNEWSWPFPKGKKQTITIIPFFGIDKRYQGLPRNAPRDERFAYRIIGNLIRKACGYGSAIVGLLVDRDNVRAIKFYQNVGFQLLPEAAASDVPRYL